MHFNIFEQNAVYNCVLASAAAGFYAQSPVRMAENALTDGKVCNSARHFAAERDCAVTVAEEVIAQSVVVCGRFLGFAHIQLAAFYCAAVVANTEFATDNLYPVTAFGV